jgi:hypothetical protein
MLACAAAWIPAPARPRTLVQIVHPDNRVSRHPSADARRPGCSLIDADDPVPFVRAVKAPVAVEKPARGSRRCFRSRDAGVD